MLYIQHHPYSPFTVSPSTATLAENACMQVNVEFIPKKIGDHNEELLICYDIGKLPML